MEKYENLCDSHLGVRGGGKTLLQEGKKRVFIFSIYFNLKSKISINEIKQSIYFVKDPSFRHKSIARPNILQSIENLRPVRVFLVTKLVTREGQNCQLARKLTYKLEPKC